MQMATLARTVLPEGFIVNSGNLNHNCLNRDDYRYIDSLMYRSEQVQTIN